MIRYKHHEKKIIKAGCLKQCHCFSTNEKNKKINAIKVINKSDKKDPVTKAKGSRINKMDCKNRIFLSKMEIILIIYYYNNILYNKFIYKI